MTTSVKQFEVKVNLSKVSKYLQNCKLREYTGEFPVVKITAKSPDHACHLVYKNFFDLLLGEKGFNEKRLMSIRHNMSIKSIRITDA